MLQNRDNTNKWNDVGFAIFFYISLIFNAGFAVYGYIKHGNELFHGGSIKLEVSFADIVYLSSVCGLTVLFSMLWIAIMSACTNAIIKASLLFELVIEIAVGIYSCFVNPIAAAFCFLFVLLRAIWLYYVWKYIPFCQSLFAVSLTAFKQHWNPILVHTFMAIVCVAVFLMDLVSMAVTNKLFGHTQDGQTALFSVGFIQLVFIFWHCAAIENIAYVTSCGVMVQYLNQQTVNMWRKFVNAATKLFGSICFGTLLEAIVFALRMIVSQRRREAERNGNAVQMVCLCCAECLLRILGDILEYINSYVYVYIAKNQTGYVESAKDVGGMFSRTGFLPLVNDWVLNAPLMVGGLFLILLTAGITVIFVNTVNVAIIAVAVACAVFIYSAMVTVISAYIKVTFVMWAEDRNVFAQHQPQYSAILDQAAGENSALPVA